MFNLAYAASADYIVSYDGAVRDAATTLGFLCIQPEDLLEVLRHHY